MKITFGAWRLDEKRPSSYMTFDCPPDYSISVDKNDHNRMDDFVDEIWNKYPNERFCYGEYRPSLKVRLMNKIGFIGLSAFSFVCIVGLVVVEYMFY